MNNQKICGLLGLATRAGKVIFGTEAVITGLEKRKIKLLLIATDAAERTKLNFSKLNEKYKLDYVEALDTDLISKAIGKNNKVIVGITDVNFSKEILKIINGGENIG